MARLPRCLIGLMGEISVLAFKMVCILQECHSFERTLFLFMPDLCKNNWVESNPKGETFHNISSDCCTMDLDRRHCVSVPSGLHGGERVRGSQSGDNHIPLQVHQRRLSKELRLQRRSTRQPARGGHPVRPQKSQRVWEEHHQPQTLQVSAATFCGYRHIHLIVKL